MYVGGRYCRFHSVPPQLNHGHLATHSTAMHSLIVEARVMVYIELE